MDLKLFNETQMNLHVYFLELVKLMCSSLSLSLSLFFFFSLDLFLNFGNNFDYSYFHLRAQLFCLLQ